MTLPKSEVTQSRIMKAIKFISGQQKQMEILRQQLNHQIMFNLQDTYMQIANRQTSVNIKQIAAFLDISDFNNEILQKLVKWNSYQNSLNLSFVQFSALLISKEDRLLAKMVLQREEMGAMPNFLLHLTRKIFRIQLQIHQYCINLHLPNFQFIRWLQQVIDENGDLDKMLLNNFLNSEGEIDEVQTDLQQVQSLFIRYLQTTGNITAERLKYLWLGHRKSSSQDLLTKFQKESTCITIPKSPKSLASCKSMKQYSTGWLRSEYFDCINRPLINEDKQVRKKKSIQKHMKRFGLSGTKKFKNQLKNLQRNQIYLCVRVILQKLKQIITIEQQTQNFRAQLCLCTDFYPVIFYDTIPKDRTSLVSAVNFKDYFQQFGYKLQINSVYLLFRKYCKQHNKLDFNSFCSLFDVSEPQYYLLQKNRFVQSLSDINIETKKLFFQVLNTVIVNQSKINQIKNQLLSTKANLTTAIDFLFKQYEDSLSDIQLKHFYQKYLDYDLSKKEIKLLWKRLGLSLKNEDKIPKYLLLKQILPEKQNKRNRHIKL